MKHLNAKQFYLRLTEKKLPNPLSGQIELTYRCNLNCLHCYCKGSEDKKRELKTADWKRLMREIKNSGCLFLTFSGGEPLVREDFLELYDYAVRRGFIITIFTNGLGFNQKVIRHMVKSPPFSIEITINGIRKRTYEIISGSPGTFEKVMNNVQILAKENLNIIIKSMCLKQNKEEIVGIKKWAESLLGRPAGNRYRFKCGPMIFPRLDGDNAPLAFRLTPEESLALKKKDVDFWNEYQRGIEAGFPRLKRDKEFLYHCDSWLEQFFINPYGRLKFCEFSDKYSVDLKTESFQKAFYKISPRLLQEKFKTDSPCRECHLRPICYYCPARAYLETGNEEGPVGYYCALSKALQGQERML